MGKVIKSLIFDLDGTLVDSRAGILDSLKKAVMVVLPQQDVEYLHFKIGPPIREIMQSALGLSDEIKLAALEMAFRSNYDSDGWKMVSIYPGVEEVLSQLRQRGSRLFILTNKPQEPTSYILPYLGLDHYFEGILNRNSCQPPFRDKVEMLMFLLVEYHIERGDALYIGDSTEDLDAAEECQVGFIGIEYGYGSFSGRKHMQLIRSFPELMSKL